MGNSESVEDAKVLLLKEAKDFVADYWHIKNQFQPRMTEAERIVYFAEQYAAKQIERQTPAIIDEFIAEVKKEVKSSDNYLIDQDPESGICIYDFAQAMQTVKARREGGEGK